MLGDRTQTIDQSVVLCQAATELMDDNDMSIMLIFSHQENLLKYECNLIIPKHHKIYIQT